MAKRIISVFCCLAVLLGTLALMSCKKVSGDADNTAGNTESGFNADEWTGEVELPAAIATKIPENYVVPVREDGETDDSAAINRALESIKETGGTIYFCESR